MKRTFSIILTLAFFLLLLSSCGQQKEHIITVAESHPGCLAVEDDCFYGRDENGNYWRIFWNDTSDIAEGEVYEVKIKSRKILFYPGGYTNGWTPRYEAAATTVREVTHGLEFRIAEDVNDFDFSSYQQKYGMFGGYEYYGTGYVPTLDEDGQQIDPEHCVIYTVTNYPDYSSNSRHITRITITDPAVTVYGLSIPSTAEEIRSVMESEGFTVTGTDTAIRAEKDNFRFTFSRDAITINAEVTNRFGIIY